MAEYNANPGIDWGKVIPMLQWERGVQADRQAQEEQAIRWQGEQDYRTLVDSGVDSMEAFRRTATKLFHNDPRGLASAVKSMRNPIPRAEIRPYSRYNKDTGVRQTFTAPEYADQQREDAITAKQAEYNASAEVAGGSSVNPMNWFGRRGKALETMNASSNLLAQAGVNAQTGKPIPPSFRGASGGSAPAATPEMIAAFKTLPQTAPTAPGPAQMPSTEIVVVIGPNGRRGRIPRSQLNDALKQGFTLPK